MGFRRPDNFWRAAQEENPSHIQPATATLPHPAAPTTAANQGSLASAVVGLPVNQALLARSEVAISQHAQPARGATTLSLNSVSPWAQQVQVWNRPRLPQAIPPVSITPPKITRHTSSMRFKTNQRSCKGSIHNSSSCAPKSSMCSRSAVNLDP